MLVPDNPFWRFSVRVYAAPGVSAECLALQDAFGIDVNLLLFAAWAGAGPRIALRADDVAAAEVTVAEWRERIVHRLRATRRDIKAMPILAEPAVAAFRKRVAEIEFDAERIEQALLWRWATGRWSEAQAAPSRPVRANIETYLGRRVGGERGALRAECLAEAALSHRDEASIR